MTKEDIFFMMFETLIKANNENATTTCEFIRSEMLKLPTNSKIYVVASPTDEIRCKSKDMAKELWESNDSFTEFYYFNPKGETHTIKKR